ncbi:rodlin [Streptomyces sp. NPDC020883]|uniref:rodlin n=1 Tax=Streptomyces sp. NPDC020883 TaxID=3365099 RepID=UPI0037AAFDD5
MIKHALAAAALMLTLGVVSAAPAAADTGTRDGNHAQDAYGNTATHGAMDPQLSLIEGTLNRPCVAIPIKANIQQLIGLVNIVSLQDIPILSAPQNQQCTDNSTQAKGDEPLSHILDQIPVLSSNGVDNG